MRTFYVVIVLLIGINLFGKDALTLVNSPSTILSDALLLVGPTNQSAASKQMIKNGDQLSFMGDSITAAGGYYKLAGKVLKEAVHLDLSPVNGKGVGGQKAEDMEPRFERDMKLSKNTWVFINVGINDVWHRISKPHDPAVLEEYKANVSKMTEKGLAAGANVVLLSPTIIKEEPGSEGNKRLPLYVDAMRTVATEKKCFFVDLHGMFLSALAHKPPEIHLTSDGVHMLVLGDAIMAIGVLRALGVSDKTIGAYDTSAALNIRGLNVPLINAAELLEVPVSRFQKPELMKWLSFN